MNKPLRKGGICAIVVICLAVLNYIISFILGKTLGSTSRTYLYTSLVLSTIFILAQGILSLYFFKAFSLLGTKINNKLMRVSSKFFYVITIICLILFIIMEIFAVLLITRVPADYLQAYQSGQTNLTAVQAAALAGSMQSIVILGVIMGILAIIFLLIGIATAVFCIIFLVSLFKFKESRTAKNAGIWGVISAGVLIIGLIIFMIGMISYSIANTTTDSTGAVSTPKASSIFEMGGVVISGAVIMGASYIFALVFVIFLIKLLFEASKRYDGREVKEEIERPVKRTKKK